MADLHSIDHRIYGKRKRGIDTFPFYLEALAALLGCITPLAAASLLAFCLLYTPCVAAIASVKRELGSKWAVGVVVGQCVIAWIVAFVVHLVGGFFF